MLNHTARLLVDAEPAKAFELVTQVAVLYPDLGPEPWHTRLKDLRKKLESLQPPPAPAGGGGTSPSAPPAGKPGSGGTGGAP